MAVTTKMWRLCLICAAVIDLVLFSGMSVSVCAQDGFPGSSHVNGTVKAPDSSSDASDSGRSSVSSTSSSGTSKIKTGDTDLFLPVIGLILAAAAAGGVCAAKKRRRERA